MSYLPISGWFAVAFTIVGTSSALVTPLRWISASMSVASNRGMNTCVPATLVIAKVEAASAR